ncbi:MAG TPA: imidazole glycerol phosphate synthase subunit HisH [Spirochaetia bacterium]|nr:imidazole glycerol phosphate synthase subunit HisH [Spirochaetia bacterium]
MVDYQAGNLRSVETALHHLGADFVVSCDPDALLRTDRLIFPGDGHAGAAMKVLESGGLGDAITTFFSAGKPVFGICLGCQIVLERSEETESPCLGIVAGGAKLFPFARDRETSAPATGERLKVPHMGWNAVHPVHSDPLFTGVPDGASFYFVHSYYTEPAAENVLCTTDYGIEFASGLRKRNLWAVQFHPEKSGEHGLRMLRNFLEVEL